MDRERIIQKIQKLLALARDGSNIHESARAAAQAEAMMRKHQLDHAELLVDRLTKADIEERTFRGGDRQLPGWINTLAVGVAKANECEASRSGPVIIFYGTPEDVPVAYELMNYLVHEIDRLAKKFKGGRGAKGSFRRGCASTLTERLMTLAAERKREFQATSTGTALVVKKQELIEDYFGGSFKYGNAHTREHSGGYAAGCRAGANVNLNQQITGGASNVAGLEHQ